ncbi:MAG: hypothetical protein RIG82_02040 [Phycisphaeraceae bacterium]
MHSIWWSIGLGFFVTVPLAALMLFYSERHLKQWRRVILACVISAIDGASFHYLGTHGYLST